MPTTIGIQSGEAIRILLANDYTIEVREDEDGLLVRCPDEGCSMYIETGHGAGEFKLKPVADYDPTECVVREHVSYGKTELEP